MNTNNLTGLRRGAAVTDMPASVPRPPTRWVSRWLVPGAILAATAGLLLYTARRTIAGGLDVRVAPVVTRPVTSAAAARPAGANATDAGENGRTPVTGTASFQAAGWVEPDPFPVNVSALADGVVADVLVLEGDPVEAGQTVARLVDEDARLALARAEAELQRMEATVASAQARLQAAEQDWEHPIERTRAVDAAEAMLAESRADLVELSALHAVEQAKLAELEDQLRFTAEARANRAASEIEHSQLTLKVASQRAAVDAVEARRPVLEAQVRRHEAELAAARAHIDLRIPETRERAEARADLALAQADLARARAARDEAALRLDRMAVKAPVAGVVMERLAEPGQLLMLSMDRPQAGYAVRIYDPQRLQVRVDVPLADAGKVRIGQGARIVVDVLPGYEFAGTVTRIVHKADLQKNTLQVKVAVADPRPELKPEMLARVKFLAGAGGDPGGANGAGGAGGPAPGTSGGIRGVGLFAPRIAIGDGPSAWIVDHRNEVARQRRLTLGEGHGPWVRVLEGLQPGDLLIANPPATLRDGTPVRVIGEAPVTDQTPEGGAS